MEVAHGICRVSVAPLRSTDSDRAEIVSQLLFGDYVRILEKTEKWFRVQQAYDGYEGWVDFRQLASIAEEDYLTKQTIMPTTWHLQRHSTQSKQATGVSITWQQAAAFQTIQKAIAFWVSNALRLTFSHYPLTTTNRRITSCRITIFRILLWSMPFSI
jgi:hypothetical protein